MSPITRGLEQGIDTRRILRKLLDWVIPRRRGALSTYLPQSDKRRIFLCRKCGRTFSKTRDTVFFALRTPEEKVMMALKMLLVKAGLSDIGFVVGMTEETVLMWLERAAQKAHERNGGTRAYRDLGGSSEGRHGNGADRGVVFSLCPTSIHG